MATLKGGDALEKKLAELSQNVTNASTLRVGWPQNATYPDGTSVALIAAINEFGAPSRGQPPRPFIRNMIAQESPHWAAQVATLLKLNNYDARATLNMMGTEIVGQVQDSIDALVTPPLAPSTIAKKGHDKPLIDSGLMRKTVTYEIIESSGGGWFSRAVSKVKGWFGF